MINDETRNTHIGTEVIDKKHFEDSLVVCNNKYQGRDEKVKI